MKKRLLYIDVCIIKVIAILMVIVSHYYRFFSPESSANGLKSIGFFGASLFAFLSGYLCQLNKDKVLKLGYIWLVKKIYTVFIPYVIVNILSLFVYKSDMNIFSQIFLGSNDGVLWYVPFIMVFYIIYFIIVSNDLPLCSLLYIGSAIYFLLQKCGADSQWYTSIGSLLLGIYCTKIKNKFKYILIFGSIFVISSVLAIKIHEFVLFKNLFTTMSGGGFCCVLYIISMNLPTKDFGGYVFNKCVSVINSSTYWLYLVHMKVGFVLKDLEGILSEISSYLIFSVCFAIAGNVLYMIIMNRIGKILLLKRMKGKNEKNTSTSS